MSKIDYKAMYEDLIEDIRKNGCLDICNICVGSIPPCNGEACDFECDTCQRECRCRNCLNDNQWKWRGGAVLELTEDDSPLTKIN